MLSIMKSSSHTDKELQKTLFLVIFTRVLALVLFIAGIFEFIPAWILRNAIDQVHLWHIAELTALAALLLGISVLVFSFEPLKKPLLGFFLVTALVILAIGIMPFDTRGGMLLFVALVLALAYPHRRVLSTMQPEGSFSVSLAGLTLLFALLLIPHIQQEVYLQIIGGLQGDSHAKFLHWIGSALLYVLLILAGGFSATKRPGWKTLAAITGITYCYLGVTAMIVPLYAGSWGTTGGLFALLGGILYVLFLLAEVESIRVKRETSVKTTL